MTRSFAALVISLCYVIPAMPLNWQLCLEQNQGFSRLPEGDSALRPLVKLQQRLSERLKQVNPTKPLEPQLSEAEQRGLILLQNCQLWLGLWDVSAVVMQMPTGTEAWRTYLEQRQMRSQLQLFSDPERLAQQVKALRRKLEQLEATQSYWKQMNATERQFLEDLQRELPLVEEFVRSLK